MARGNQIEVDRGGFLHHGVDLDDGTVIHFNSETGSDHKLWVRAHKSRIRRTSRE